MSDKESDLELIEIGMEIVRELIENPPANKCKVCGAELEWVECWKCFGEGGFDETDIDPLEGDEFSVCDECCGQGGYLECPDLPHKKGETCTTKMN